MEMTRRESALGALLALAVPLLPREAKAGPERDWDKLRSKLPFRTVNEETTAFGPGDNHGWNHTYRPACRVRVARVIDGARLTIGSVDGDGRWDCRCAIIVDGEDVTRLVKARYAARMEAARPGDVITFSRFQPDKDGRPSWCGDGLGLVLYRRAVVGPSRGSIGPEWWVGHLEDIRRFQGRIKVA